MKTIVCFTAAMICSLAQVQASEQEPGWFWKSANIAATYAAHDPTEIASDLRYLPKKYEPGMEARRGELLGLFENKKTAMVVKHALYVHLSLTPEQYRMSIQQLLVLEGWKFNLRMGYDYAAAMSSLTQTLVRHIAPDAKESDVVATLNAAGWVVGEDDVAYARKVILPSLK